TRAGVRRRPVGSRRPPDSGRPGRWRRHGAPASDRQPRGALPRHDRGGRRMIAVYRWEIAKLLVQKRTYLGLVAAMGIPLAFVIVLLARSGGPNDALLGLGRHVRDTGLVVPFVVLLFMSFWAFPLITALVAGDIVAAEHHNG